MHIYLKNTLSVCLAGLLLTACSSDSDSAVTLAGNGDTNATVAPTGNYVGYLTDSPIVGLNYECGDIVALTGADGVFHCSTLPVVFKVGSYTIGSISAIPQDSKVFPQDILGLDRDNKSDQNLVELVQFFQALDDDGDISEYITISKERREEFKDINGSNGGGSGGTSGSGGGIPGGGEGSSGSISPKEAGRAAGLPLPDPASAMDHLRKTINPTDYQRADTSDLSPYIGEWAGGGWGWEVRFKQNYGDFTSEFLGVDRDDLPFKGEKNIMSLMVKHETAFTFNVAADGSVTGEGTITYDLVPNLCGLNSLTTNLINPTVGMFDKIFTLTGMVGADNALESVKGGANLSNIIEDAASLSDTVASFSGNDFASQLMDRAKKFATDAKQTSDICRVVSENPNISGGLSVGPLSLEELLTNATFDVAKSLTTPKQPLGFILSVPGVTQIQYEYKGLQNGPEERKFSISGYIDSLGKLYLTMEDITDGSEDLTVEYTVNWQTERPTFPAWSPFLDNGATIYPGNRNVTIYNYVDENVDKDYTQYDATGTASTKTISVPMPKLVAKTKYLTLPMAIFKESGTHRNDVSVWHEYEYSWNAYKIGN